MQEPAHTELTGLCLQTSNPGSVLDKVLNSVVGDYLALLIMVSMTSVAALYRMLTMYKSQVVNFVYPLLIPIVHSKIACIAHILPCENKTLVFREGSD
jgi:hypothetical protein